MVREGETLKRVSTYAKQNGYSRAMVYYWINKGEIDSRTIDGVVFVVVKDLQR